MNKFSEVINEFIPPRESLISVHDVVKETERKGSPITLRTLQYYATMRLIDKPIHIGKEAFYEKDYILDELSSIFVLKSIFHYKIGDLKELVQYRRLTFKTIMTGLSNILKDFFAHDARGIRPKHAPLVFNIENSSLAQAIVWRYIDKVRDGKPPLEITRKELVKEIDDETPDIEDDSPEEKIR